MALNYAKNIAYTWGYADFEFTDGYAQAFGADGAENGYPRNLLISYIRAKGVYAKISSTPPTWSAGDRNSAVKTGDIGEYAIMHAFIDQSGAGWRYRADMDTNHPKGPEGESHGLYQQITAFDSHHSDIFFSRSCGSATQARSVGNIIRCVTYGQNTGMNPNAGCVDYAGTFDPADFYGGNYGFVSDYWQTANGFKGNWEGLIGVVGGGVSLQSLDMTIINSGMINNGEPRQFLSSTDFGPGVNFASSPGVTNINSSNYWPIKSTITPAGDSIKRCEFYVSNCNRDEFPDGLYNDATGIKSGDFPGGTPNEATRDAATLEAYAASVMGGTPTVEEFSEWVMDQEDFYIHARGYANFCRAALGLPIITPVDDETLTFEPAVEGGTPGRQLLIEEDWDKKYLPGEALRNSVVIPQEVDSNYTPLNDWQNVLFKPYAGIRQQGGRMSPQGTFTVDLTGNYWKLERGSQLDMPAHASANPLNLEAIESMIRFMGDCTGNVNVTGRYKSKIIVWEGTDVVVPSGSEWELLGDCRAGFDGSSGAAASITFATGSKLTFRPGACMDIDGLNRFSSAMASDGRSVNATYEPDRDSTFDGQTSTASARVYEMIQNANNAAYYIVDQLTGLFLDNENIIAPKSHWYCWSTGSQTIGQVNGAPVYKYARCGEVKTGMVPFVGGVYVVPDTNIVSTVNLNCTLHLDVIGMADGPYLLWDNIDVLNMNLDALTAENNTGRTIILNKVGQSLELQLGTGATSITDNT